ncbi:MAG: hypothetical protein ABW250_26800 [Pyrinomonadaceae bacterium]
MGKKKPAADATAPDTEKAKGATESASAAPPVSTSEAQAIEPAAEVSEVLVEDDGATEAEQDEVSPPALLPSLDSGADSAPPSPSSGDGSAAAEQPRPSAPLAPEPVLPPPPVEATPVRVVVMVEHLGPRGFRRGQVTNDPKIVAMLGDGSGRVTLAGEEFFTE